VTELSHYKFYRCSKCKFYA